jgi:hypothetical protein
MRSVRVPAARGADVIEIQFTGAALDPASVLRPMAFDIRPAADVPPGHVLAAPGNLARYFQPDGLRGAYLIRLVGGPEEGNDAPAISSIDGLRLDGDRTSAWPSGDGHEGGDFEFRVTIT